MVFGTPREAEIFGDSRIHYLEGFISFSLTNSDRSHERASVKVPIGGSSNVDPSMAQSMWISVMLPPQSAKAARRPAGDAGAPVRSPMNRTIPDLTEYMSSRTP
jgi:hypothetical protein